MADQLKRQNPGDVVAFGPQGEPLLRYTEKPGTLTRIDGVNPYRILHEATAVLHAEGLTDWRVWLVDEIILSNGQPAYGTCNPDTKTIKLSKSMMPSVAEARDTYLHEIGHALQFQHHGVAHDACLSELRRKHSRTD